MTNEELQVPLSGVSSGCELTEEQKENFRKVYEEIRAVVQRVSEEIARIVQTIWEAIKPIVKAIAEKLSCFYEVVLKTYPNRRVVWLALHHKRERVRKKNKARILRWLFREGRCLQ